MARVHPETRSQVAAVKSDSLSVNPLYLKDMLSIKKMSLQQIELVLDTAQKIKAGEFAPNLQNKIIASCFFEPSTRTRLSFESAALRSNGQIIGFSSTDTLSTKKGESLHDTIKVTSSYADLLVMRHPMEGASRLAADISDVPVVNAGDGANQHPTQTLIDLFSMRESQGGLDELAVALVGDLKYGRTINSLAQACQLFNIRLYLVAPESLIPSDDLCNYLKRKSVRFSFHKSLHEIIDKVDIVYMTRVQKERIPASEYQASMHAFSLTNDMLENVKPTMRVLHPLPRVDEIQESVDQTEHAYYFQQAANGVFVRQAILSLILNKELS